MTLSVTLLADLNCILLRIRACDRDQIEVLGVEQLHREFANRLSVLFVEHQAATGDTFTAYVPLPIIENQLFLFLH